MLCMFSQHTVLTQLAISFSVQTARVIINGRVMNTTGDPKERGRPRSE